MNVIGSLARALSLCGAIFFGGCVSEPDTVASSEPAADKPCPQCRMVHYAWRDRARYHDVDREADVMQCPCCHSAHANAWRGIKGPSCDICGADRERCPICRGENY